MNFNAHLGFPQPLLGLRPLRLQVVYDDGQLLALGKPVDILVQAESWYPRLPVLIEAIRYQAAAGKPEFRNINIPETGLWAISDLDPEFYGPVLFARDREIAAHLRNEVGSSQMEFTYLFLTASHIDAKTMQCDLPLSRHRNANRMLVSHTTGKQAVTDFRKVEETARYSVWEAKAAFPRRHQLLVHSLELGIPVLGDILYACDQPLLLSRFKRHYQKKRDMDERPLYPGPACFLKQIKVTNDITIDCPPPAKWGGLLKQLAKHRG